MVGPVSWAMHRVAYIIHNKMKHYDSCSNPNYSRSLHIEGSLEPLSVL